MAGDDEGANDPAPTVEVVVLTPPSDIDALVAFGPRDGRDGGWNSA